MISPPICIKPTMLSRAWLCRPAAVGSCLTSGPAALPRAPVSRFPLSYSAVLCSRGMCTVVCQDTVTKKIAWPSQMGLSRPSSLECEMNRAVILAGGRGTRLRPYTVSLPKPLMPIVDHPILEIIIRQLARAGFEHVTLTVNYQAEIFRAYFGDGSKWRIRIDYSLETQPLGTMGPLRLIPDLPNDFLVMNGDILTDLDFRVFLSEHTQGRRLFSISAAAREQRIDYGVLNVGRDGLLSAFQEKPITAYLVSMGI